MIPNRCLAGLLLLSMVGCSNAGPPPTTQEQACQNAANDDPTVRENLGKEAGNLNYQYQHEPEIRQAKLDAVTRCLRARGLAPRGGVERLR